MGGLKYREPYTYLVIGGGCAVQHHIEMLNQHVLHGPLVRLDAASWGMSIFQWSRLALSVHSLGQAHLSNVTGMRPSRPGASPPTQSSAPTNRNFRAGPMLLHNGGSLDWPPSVDGNDGLYEGELIPRHSRELGG